MNAAISEPPVKRPLPATYVARLATDAATLRATQALRFAVFNLEMREGLASAYDQGLDADEFDTVFDHLVVEETATGRIVGAYRLQTGENAQATRGYYSEREFDFTPFAPLRSQIIELGRACVHRDHRNRLVLGLLWRGIAAYARAQNSRYLIGCSSLTSRDPAVGATAFQELRKQYLAPPAWQTRPHPAYACALDKLAESPVKVPRLLAAYLSLGARICGPPALDQEFGSIDFLTLLDFQALPPAAVEHFWGVS